MQYSGSFKLRIITPTRVVYDEDTSGVRVPGSIAPFEILIGHAPIVSQLETGEVRIAQGTGSSPQFRYMAITGGVVEARRDGVSLLVDAAEWSDEIDTERAESARQRAVERLRTFASDIDATRAEAALSRAINRLRIKQRGG